MSNELKPRFSINRNIDGHPIYDSKTDEHYFNFDKLGVRDLLNGLDGAVSKPRIKLTKTLPSEEGDYYWVFENQDGQKSRPMIVSASYFDGYEESDDLHVAGADGDYTFVDYLGGYWAKVEQDHFVFGE